jgi:FADH2-dependent halogenase
VTETRSSDYDAIVIGGGPSGSSYSMTLGRGGHSVLVLEREKFPRFHVGESLITYTVDVLEQLGVLDKVVQAGFPKKWGIEFCSTGTGFQRLDLQDVGEDRRKWALQVERSHFDQILLDTAAATPGVTVYQEARVTELLYSGERVSGVRYTLGGQEHTATGRFVIDASGRAGVIARAHNLRKTDHRLKMAAVIKHFGGVDEANNPGAEGDIQLAVHDDGWLWAIPIRSDVMSVGCMVPADILRASRPEEAYDAYLDQIPRIKERIKGTTVIRDLSGENNFEYHCDTLAGPGYFIVGDSGCFTDPVFSGGVLLALTTGRRAAEETALVLAGEADEAEVALRYQNFFKTGYESYYRLICAVYDENYIPVDEQLKELKKNWRFIGAGWAGIRVMTQGTLGGFNYAGVLEDSTLLRTVRKVEPRWHLRAVNGDFWSGENQFFNYLREVEEWRLFDSFEPMHECPVHPEG